MTDAGGTRHEGERIVGGNGMALCRDPLPNGDEVQRPADDQGVQRGDFPDPRTLGVLTGVVLEAGLVFGSETRIPSIADEEVTDLFTAASRISDFSR